MTFTLLQAGAARAGALALIGLFPLTLPAQATPPKPVANPVARRVIPPAPTAPLTFDSTVFGALRWREMGPSRGGRSVAKSARVGAARLRNKNCS